MRRLLDDNELDRLGTDLPQWTLAADRTSLSRSCRFPDFRAAFAFMTRIAGIAEELDHHPDWSNSYGRVDIVLTTHDAGGLTALDREMARRIDTLQL